VSEKDTDLIKLLITLRDANAMTVEAINAYLEAKAPPEVKFEKVAELFPKDLKDLLTFEDTPEWTLIRPRKYLGKENFAKIAAIIKDHGGEYVSAGKNSHFRLPKKT
jgi:hypothetical protein